MPPMPPATLNLSDLNAAAPEAAGAMLSPVIERSPWLADRIVANRPFRDAQALADAVASAIRQLDDEEALTLLRAHPELAPPAPEAMTAASQSEQGRLGLVDPAPEVAARLAALNARYDARFGFPFIIALHAQPDLASVFAQFEGRLENTAPVEQARALEEIVSVATARLARVTGQSLAPRGAVGGEA